VKRKKIIRLVAKRNLFVKKKKNLKSSSGSSSEKEGAEKRSRRRTRAWKSWSLVILSSVVFRRRLRCFDVFRLYNRYSIGRKRLEIVTVVRKAPLNSPGKVLPADVQRRRKVFHFFFKCGNETKTPSVVQFSVEAVTSLDWLTSFSETFLHLIC